MVPEMKRQPFHFFDDLQDPSTSISEQLARLVVGEVCGGLLALARRRKASAAVA
jgi:hypothetical protein